MHYALLNDVYSNEILRAIGRSLTEESGVQASLRWNMFSFERVKPWFRITRDECLKL